MGLFFEDHDAGNMHTGCAGCPLVKPNLNIIPSLGNKNKAEVLILGSGVSRKDILTQKICSDYDDTEIHKIRDMFDVYFSTVTRCFIPENINKKDIPNIIKSCKINWEYDLDIPNLKGIVAYGEAAFKSLTGLSNIGLWRRTFVPIRHGDKILKVYPLLNPSDFDNRKKRLIKDLIKIDIKYFMNNAKKVWDTPVTFLSDSISDHVSTVKCLMSKNDIIDGLDRFKHYPETYLDYETTSLYPTLTDNEKILTLSLSYKYDTIAFPVQHPNAPSGILDLWTDYLRETFNQRRIAHNLQFELMWTRSLFASKEMANRIYHEYKWGDTQAKAYAMSIPPGRLSLGDLTHAYFGTNLKSICDVDPVQWYKYPLNKLLLYNGMDSLWTNKLDNQVKLPKWAEEEYNHHLLIIPSLVEMYYTGIEADIKSWEDIRNKLKISEEELLSEIANFVKESGYRKEMLPSSPASLLQWFRFMELEIENTKEETLQEFTNEHPAIDSILEFKSIKKLRSTYAEGLVNVLHSDERFHAAYSSLRVKSGRLNCKDPNLQQIPKRKAAYVRKLFIPGKDRVFLALDQAQLEVRILACASRDPVLIEYIKNESDIHLEWAEYLIKRDPTAKKRYAEKFKMDIDNPKLLSKIRGEMKSGFVFLSFYGGSSKKCAKMMGVELGLAEEAQELLFKKYSGVKEYQQKSWENYKRLGYVETLTGRRMSGVLSWNQAINLPIQGTGSDLVTHAGARLCKLSFETKNMNILPKINIHDDNTFNPKKINLDESLLICAKEMVRPVSWMTVPFAVEASVGDNWYEMTPYTYQGNKTLTTEYFYPNFLKEEK